VLAHLPDGLLDLDDTHAITHVASVAAGDGKSVGRPARTA
jgi:hypothetical protein